MYGLAKIIRKVLLILPLNLCLYLGKLVGMALYFNCKKRSVSFKNIKMAFPNKKTYQVKQILKKSFINFGISIVETLILPKIIEYSRIVGEENIDKSGGILIGIHEGSWEVYNTLFAKKHKYAILVKEQKKRGLNRFINEIRKEEGLYICNSLKELVKYLKKEYFAGIVVDHGAEDNALLVEFFSHLVPTPKGAVFLSKKLDKKVYPCFGRRLEGFSHIAEIGKPLDIQSDEKDLLRKINKIYEEYLRRYPSQYLWYYKRFKYKKDLDILVLSDGKVGHLRQSQAFLSIFSEENYKIRSKTVEVKYKNKVSEILAFLASLSAGKRCGGCGKCLSLFLDRVTYKELEQTYADIVISTGTSIAPINRLFSCYLVAKSVAILRSNIPLNKFDLNIIPEHDRIEGDNTVKIKGALFYPYSIEEKIKNCKKFFNLSENKKISVILGGALRDEEEYMNNLKVFIDRIKEFSLANNYKLLLSTSRRSSPRVEDYLEKEMGKFKNIEALVIANKANYDFVFDGFVSLSEIVFVSSESISMLSEAASLNKPCVGILLERYYDKHYVFLQSMKKEINFLEYPYDIKNFTPRVSSIFQENKSRVKEAIKGLL
jgi:lauroyl/myristoyl acyltransferase